MASLSSFAKRIEVRAARVAENVDKTVRKVALAVDQAVVLGTPVDTGLARSNWQVMLGTRPKGVISPYQPGKMLGIGETANASAAIEQGAAEIGRRLPGQDIHITNNVPYIGKLNDGSSSQAPAGFVESAVAAAAAEVANARVV